MLITIFAPSKVHLLEVAGVRDALFEANCKMASADRYRVNLVTERGVAEVSASGMTFVPDAGIEDATEPCDTLIVAGPYGVPAQPSEAVTQWLQVQARQSRRYGSTCTGAFLLAHAGLLANRRATTHWEYAERLAAEFPDVQVEPDRIFIRDGPVFSSWGGSCNRSRLFADRGRSWPCACPLGGSPTGRVPEAAWRSVAIQCRVDSASRNYQPDRQDKDAHPSASSCRARP